MILAKYQMEHLGYRVGLLYTYGVSTNKISINRMVELLSTNPAKIYGLYPQKEL